MSTEYKSNSARRPRFYRGDHRMHSGRRPWWQPRHGAVVIPWQRECDDTLAIFLFDDATTDVIQLAAAS